MSFKRLHQEGFDHQHDGGQRREHRQDAGNVDIGTRPDLESDPFDVEQLTMSTSSHQR